MNGPIDFQTTAWTQILRIGNVQEQESRELLESLIHSYWRPVFSYIRRRGRDASTAEDLTQEFFANILERNTLGNIEREGGTFRSYLLQAIRNFLISQHRYDRAAKRDPGTPILAISNMDSAVEPATPMDADAEAEFDRAWALQIMELTLDSMRAEHEISDKLVAFTVFEHQLRHRLQTGKTPSRQDIASKFDLPLKKIDNILYRAKKVFRRHLNQTVSQTVTREEQIDEEIRGLRGVLGS